MKKNENKVKEYIIHDTPLDMVSEVMVKYNVADESFNSSFDLIQLARKGITKRSLLKLSKGFSLTLKDLANALPITERSIQRYEPNDRFNTDVSEKIIEISQLYAYGFDVFGSEENFNSWMKMENIAFGYVTPVSLLDTSFGIELVRNLLGQIEHGILA